MNTVTEPKSGFDGLVMINTFLHNVFENNPSRRNTEQKRKTTQTSSSVSSIRFLSFLLFGTGVLWELRTHASAFLLIPASRVHPEVTIK